MSLLKWERSYNTGIDDIDAQHVKLFSMVNDFENSSETDSGLSLMFGVIIDCFSEHIEEEELVLQEYNYNEYLRYKQTHSNLLSAAAMVETKLDKCTKSSYYTAQMFLKHLVKLHVSKTHRSFESALHARVA